MSEETTENTTEERAATEQPVDPETTEGSTYNEDLEGIPGEIPSPSPSPETPVAELREVTSLIMDISDFPPQAIEIAASHFELAANERGSVTRRVSSILAIASTFFDEENMALRANELPDQSQEDFLGMVRQYMENRSAPTASKVSTVLTLVRDSFPAKAA